MSRAYSSSCVVGHENRHEAVGAGGCLQWFLVFSKPSQENTAKANLERQGFRVYYPRLQRQSLHRGRWISRIVSLFPRYLFIQLDTARQSLAPVRSTLGVTSLVRFGRESSVVPDEVVENIMCKADPGSGLHKLVTVAPMRRGSPVNVVSGAFEGLSGIFEREAGEERVIILLEVLGQYTAVRMPARCVTVSGGTYGRV